jgi:NADH-quinone oxidoreductase subunit M
MNIIYLIIIAVLSGLLVFATNKTNNRIAQWIGLAISSFGTIVSTMLCGTVLRANDGDVLHQSFAWLPELGARFTIHVNGLSAMLCLLTSICFVLIVLSTINKNIEKPNTFYGLLLLSYAGLIGVFIAWDALLFYTFWELALIPVYFLCSMWGGEKRMETSFKFFIYTFVGSLIMLLALLYMCNKTTDHSFSWAAFAKLKDVLSSKEQYGLFWMLFIAFAIKMPIFPLHTWQPSTYKQTYTPVTMILSAVMVKMGLFAITRWLNPILPQAGQQFSNIIMVLCVIGIVYGSLLAMAQTNIKKLVAYSSIAHIGLMCAALFSFNEIGIIGAGVQMFSHGINIIGMWILVYFIETKFKTQDLTKMGGLASVNPTFAIFLVIITLANIALPLTNGFVGEFMMFNGIFNSKYLPSNTWNIIFTVIAGLGIILSAVYSLGMVQKVAFGELKDDSLTALNTKFSPTEWIALAIVIVLILVFGFYPQPIIDLIKL